MQVETLLSFPDGWQITEVQLIDATWSFSLTSTQPQATCPLCGIPSSARHSQYQRTLRDVPCGGTPVCLILTARRFFCSASGCACQIFTERFPGFVQSHARLSDRFREELLALSIALAHEAAARLTVDLHLPTSVTTLRRQLQHAPPPTRGVPTKVGIDDFAFRRGATYGTVIVDLESHKIVDLLADRTTQTVETWLHAHPEIQGISRDRAGAYASAASSAAPQAMQVADRFHLLMNAGDCLERFLHRHAAILQDDAADHLPVSARRSQSERSAPQQHSERQRKLSHHVHDLTDQGLSQRTIARTLGIARGTVIQHQRASAPPAMITRQRPRSIDPYVPYLREQWEAGQHNAHILWEAIQSQGFPGAFSYVGKYLTQWRAEPARKGRPPLTPTLLPTTLPRSRRVFSPHRVRWLCCKDRADVTPQDAALLASYTQRCPDVVVMQDHICAFMTLVRCHERSALDPW